MILHRGNFNIPARFTFQPFAAGWRFVRAETVEWIKDPTKLRRIAIGPSDDDDDKSWLRVRIEVPDAELGIPLGDFDPSYQVRIDRASIPPDILPLHENYRSTPDISGRSFQVLICQKPEFKDPFSRLNPGEVTKNAWLMSDEFLNLEENSEFGWGWSVWQFLNKWGLWDSYSGFVKDWKSMPPRLRAPSASLPEQTIDEPDFVLVMPHLLKEEQAKYRRAVLQSNARSWLRSHPLSLDTANEFPFFRVRRSYCRDAIEATITINHLEGIRSGICKRCHRVFEKEKRYRMSYCSRSCANAASVERFREKQRKGEWTAAKVAKLLSQKGAKRNAKG